MSKNTNISELINYLSYDGSGNIVFNTVSSAATNTDKFLVSDTGVLKFRTAAQLLSDIGAQASGSYQAALSGTGFVKISGSTISYDNSTYATETYVGTAVSNLVGAAPSTLDTLNELATALGNDANFATTIATSIGTKQPQLNGTGFVKISGTTISYDSSTYLTTATASSTYLPLAGGTLTGALTLPASGYIDNLASLKYAAYSWASYNTSTGAISFQNATAGGLSINAGGVTFSNNVGINGANAANPLTVKVDTNLQLRVDQYLSSTNLASINAAASAYMAMKIDGITLELNSQSGGKVFSADLTAGISTYRTTIQGLSSGASVRFGTLATDDFLGKIGTYQSAFNIDSSNGPISFKFAAVEKASLSSSGTFKAIQYRIAPNGVETVYFIVDSDQTYTGQLSIQAGGGSAGYGGSLMLYGHARSGRAGYVSAGISSGSGGKFTVMTAGNGSGSDVFTVDTSGNVNVTGYDYSNSRSYHEDTASFGSNGIWQQSLGGIRFNGYNGYNTVHIKTSIRHDSSCMISFNVRGFWYGPQSVDTDIQFYCYGGTNTLYGFGVYEKAEASWDYGGYYSSDDYVVLWVSGLNNYAGFSLNANNTSLIQHGVVGITAWTKANTTSAQY